MELINGKIVTKFKNGNVTEIKTKVNSETGEMYPQVVEHINIDDISSSVFIEDNGKHYDICQECQEYILFDGKCANCDTGAWF